VFARVLPLTGSGVQAAAALQAERMRRALEARAVVAQVAEQKEADRAALAAAQVSMTFISPFALQSHAFIHPFTCVSIQLTILSSYHTFRYIQCAYSRTNQPNCSEFSRMSEQRRYNQTM